MEVEATRAGATIYQLMQIGSDGTYQCNVNVAGAGRILVGVGREDGTFVGNPIEIISDGGTRRYTVRFRANGGTANVRVPMIQLPDVGTRAYIDHVSLTRVEASGS